MNAEERTISKILTDQICYEIPSYQRPYSWGKENVQELLEDLWEAYEGNEPEYFIGSIITVERAKDKLYDVVDGQQRLTTLNLIFARLRDAIADEKAKALLGNRILPRNDLTGEAETPRLQLRKVDQSFFRKHVLESAPVLANSRAALTSPQKHLIENSEEIDAFCKGKAEQVLKLFANYVLSKVYVVFVTTQSLQSAYRLFNVLNARGIPLSNADLIKNTLFSQLGAQVNRSDELEERWLELEEELGIERMDAFFSHHRTSLAAAKARGSLHEEIEPLIKTSEGGPFAFLDMVLASAKNFSRVIEQNFQDAATLRPLRALRRVAYDEWIPALLAFLNSPTPGLPEAEFISLLEKVTMQNWICRLGRTARLTVYFQLISAIKANKSADEIRAIFTKNARNDEFVTLLGGNVYGQAFDEAVLLRLEEANQDESVTKSYSGRLTIEHVLPQALRDDYWKQRFTEDLQRLWIHRLGNLALLSGNKNYKAQYFGFDRKKKIYSDRNKKVSFDLTKEVSDQAEWTEDMIKARQDRLLKLAGETWKI
jgi:hypothetical protein